MTYLINNKVFFLLIVFFCGIQVVQAQDFKGRKSIGVSLLATQQNQTQRTNQISSGQIRGGNINLGYFLSNHWRIGVSAGTHREVSDFIAQGRENRGWNWQVFATNYHWFSKNTAFFIEPSFTYRDLTRSLNFFNGTATSIQQNQTQTYELNTSIGFLYTIGQRFGIDLSVQLIRLGYMTSNRTVEVTNTGVTEMNTSESNRTYLDITSRIDGISNMAVGFKYFF